VKSFFGRTNLEYLGYNSMHPSQKKVDAILQIKPPTTRKQLRCFIGMVNYYCDMWPLRSHLLAPLSSLTSAKVKWNWTTEHQEAFDKMKALIAKETFLTFPDFSREFEIHTDQYQFKYILKSTQEDDTAAYSLVEKCIKSLSGRVHEEDEKEAMPVRNYN
jgi:hypothetical protein